MSSETPPVSEYAAQRAKDEAEYLELAGWYTDAVDEAILGAPQDFTSSAKANSFGRQAAKASDPEKFDRLRALELKHPRFIL